MTIQDIQTEVGANPQLLVDIATTLSGNEDFTKAILPVIGQKGYIVRSKADEDSFLSTYKNRVIEEEIPTRIKEVHDRYDEDLFNLTGERKSANEKTYKFLERKIIELKNSKVDDVVLKEQLKQLQSQVEEKDTLLKTEVEKVKEKYFKKGLESMIINSLNGIEIAIPNHLSEDTDKQKYVNAQKSMMRRDFLENIQAKEDNDGNIVYFNGATPITSTIDGKPLSADAIIKDRYGIYIAKAPQSVQGVGTGKNGQSGVVPKTKEEVYQLIESRGITPLTVEFAKEYAKLTKEYGII